MKYIALTGATGLLGSYLLKDMLRMDLPVLVLVRSNRMETAQERIEAIIRRYERQLNRPLPRPVIMEANLHKPGLGLKKEEIDWIRRHVDTMLHNAASLSFIAEENGEPYRSNIDGTRHVLELCEETGIRRFHHVSTAYVCGLRKGTILESELDMNQDFGNDYEKSKFTAENMVRSASHLDSITVFRPAIIVGDSVTGYTTTFHGFYTPMKILVPLIDPKMVDVNGVLLFGQAIGMNPNDQKNFVPVDWISKVMTKVIVNPSLHDTCYHLSANNRVRIDEMSRCIAEGILQYKKSGRSLLSSGVFEMDKLLSLFHEQMTVYQAYWKDDPIFDMTNTQRAVPEYPPMTMTPHLLMTFVRYAIESQFGWPKPKKTTIDFQAADLLDSTHAKQNGLGDSDDDSLQGFTFGIRVTGPGGTDWTVRVMENRPVQISTGLPANDCPLITMNSKVFRNIDALEKAGMLSRVTSWENGSDQQRNKALDLIKSMIKIQEQV